MKPITIIGIVLIILGITALAVQGIQYSTKKEIVAIGPVEATAKTTQYIPFPPIVGGLILVGGVVLVVAGSRQA
ncbi:MAG TPA: DUF3185 domain-containing protein [Candidatus Tectomicrobia bacterium]|jgi:uncharacterized membrane protein